ncbi:TenA family protein [Lichenihabitans sp. Uapishka_5]|uniref:TenA family protein n=1 Tax=Lichenihabitans sp. Uapishka_5 TaxID=3037302 RepID=UPI0029E822F3|nr:TenA family protein [Lichenihabitans sp. Uapishka_5]MDX7953111.1 TenA family protein [Lichenihabitans sp. Uapishka_5]
MRFTDDLRAQHGAAWERAAGHRFTSQLIDGSLPDAVMARYLVQDYRFLDRFLALLGAAMATADDLAPRLRLGRFVGVVAGEENTYFERAFADLGVATARRAAEPDAAPTAGFKGLMAEAAAARSYPAALAVLCVAEWLYLDWASRAAALPPRFIHAEWITLHDNPDFRDLVGFLRAELDRVGPAEAERCQALFGRAVALEEQFFDTAFTA